MAITPIFMLKATILSSSPTDFWQDPISPDIWDGMPYKWNVVLTVDTVYHSSDQTPQPFTYNSLDVKVGQWITDNLGNALQITEVVSADGYNLECIVEDADRYNTYNDGNISGFGGFISDAALIFETSSENGMPIYGQATVGYFGFEATERITGRFTDINHVTNNIQFFQENNDFTVDDLVSYKNGKFEKSSNTRFTIGTVSSVGIPGGGWFTIKPFGSYSNNIKHDLVGDFGDIFYINNDVPGTVTLVEPEVDAYPVYIRLENEHTAFILNTANDASSTIGKIEVDVIDENANYNIGMDFQSVSYITINGLIADDFIYNKSTGILNITSTLGYNLDSSDELIVFVNR